MGYSFDITNKSNYCEHCKRSDNDELYDSGLSYNFTWALKYLKTDSGSFRQLYGVPIKDVLPKIQTILEGIRQEYPNEWQENFTRQIGYNHESPFLTKDEVYGETKTIDGDKVRYDGWATTPGNTYYHFKELYTKIAEIIADGYPNAEIHGD